jgi:coproporphyrinogen III oxidase
MILEGGKVFERAGCGFSHVTGPKLPPSATQHRPELVGAAFEAMGVSLVFHPRNPYAPTVHMNVRMLAALAEGCRAGLLVRRRHGPDAVLRLRGGRAHFHAVCRDALAPFGDDKYPRFKAWCDDYFFLKHRNEPRGVGGIFFDDHFEGGFERSFGMLRSWRRFRAGLPAHPAAAQGHALRRARAQLAAAAARPLRRIQPGVGPRHAFRPAVGRPHRIDPDVDAAAGLLGLPGGAGAGSPEAELLQRFVVRKDWV